eukprot:scaffold6742_cov93-Skeletonema_dohrnii-CCMP3373.AAC.1
MKLSSAAVLLSAAVVALPGASAATVVSDISVSGAIMSDAIMMMLQEFYRWACIPQCFLLCSPSPSLFLTAF